MKNLSYKISTSISFILLCCSLLMSCKTLQKDYEVDSKSFDSGQIQKDRLVSNYLEFNDKRVILLSLSVEREVDKIANDVSYFLNADFGGYVPLVLEINNCVDISVDGENYNFNAISEPYFSKSGYPALYVESVYLEVDKEFVYKLSNAKSVKVFFNGEYGSVMGTFSNENFLNFKKFLKQFDS